jgi:hypothetical protein
MIEEPRRKSIKELFLEIAAAEGERNVYSIKRKLNTLLLKEGREQLDDIDMYELVEAAGWLD